jgi:hypothetical protein
MPALLIVAFESAVPQAGQILRALAQLFGFVPNDLDLRSERISLLLTVSVVQKSFSDRRTPSRARSARSSLVVTVDFRKNPAAGRAEQYVLRQNRAN